MPRKPVLTFICGTAAACIGLIAYSLWDRKDHHRLLQELNDAHMTITLIRDAEKRCRGRIGRYLSLEELNTICGEKIHPLENRSIHVDISNTAEYVITITPDTTAPPKYIMQFTALPTGDMVSAPPGKWSTVPRGHWGQPSMRRLDPVK